MKNNLLALILFIFLAHKGFAHGPQEESIRFIQNKNQWYNRILYKAEIPAGAMFLEKNCFTYNLRTSNSRHPLPPANGDSLRFNGHAYKVNFLQSNPDVSFASEGESEDYINYFIGKDRAHWASHVKAFASIVYEDLYDGIDLKVYSQANAVKYDFVILPKVDPSIIQLQYEGLYRMLIRDGNLLLFTSLGEVTEQKPFAYQYINGQMLSIPCEYRLSENVVSFAFPSGYNQNYPVTIDPVLMFSTYSGSTADNFGYTATPDSKGFLYSGSTVFGVGYPVTPGAYQSTFAGGSRGFYYLDAYGNPVFIEGTDIGITKYDTTGTKRIYSTYLGGSQDEVPHSLIVNDLDELYIYGSTGSADFPFTHGAYDSTFAGGYPVAMYGIEVYYRNGCDIFISKLSNDGSTLSASTYLGGTNNDGILSSPSTPHVFGTPSVSSPLRYNYADELRGEIELDKASEVYIASCTQSTNFPMIGSSFQPLHKGGNTDGLVVKMDANLHSIIWSTYLGGNGDDAVYSIELDSSENIYISGGTTSTNFFNTAGTLYNSNQGGLSDGFISYMDKNTSAVVYSTYFGSGAYDQIYFVGLDEDNNVHVFGQTEASGAESTKFIANAAFFQANSGQFITKIKPDLSSVIWSTRFGTGSGVPNISPTAFLVDLCGKIYLSGWGGTPKNDDFLNDNTNAYNMYVKLGYNPASDFYQPNSTDQHDFYLFVLEDDASSVNYASFFGGSLSREHVDGGTSRFDRTGKIYQAMCAGCGAHSDMPIKPPFGATELPSHNNSDNCNIGVFKMDFRPPTIAGNFQANDGCLGDVTHFTYTGEKKSNTFFSWNFGDGQMSTLESPTHVYSSPGTYNVRLAVLDSGTCNLADTVYKQVYVSAITTMSIDATADQYVIYKGHSTTLRAIPSTGWNYEWTPYTGLANPYAAVTLATPAVTTTYTVQFTDPKVNSCRVSDTVTIQVIEIICREPYIYVPNAFTPNEDGKNELLYVRSRNIQDLYFAIYNRWGEKVFETRDQNVGWDGTYKGMKADPGVFDYYVEGHCIDDQQFFIKGNITLIR